MCVRQAYPLNQGKEEKKSFVRSEIPGAVSQPTCRGKTYKCVKHFLVVFTATECIVDDIH